jgi:hypothetical protein
MTPPPVAAPAVVSSKPSADPDDFVAAPAPDESVFAPRQSTAQLLAKERLEQKRMFIPILLTTGVLLPAIASLKWITGPDSVFAEMEAWVPLVLIATGVMLLAMAAINMMQVRHDLRALSVRGRR